jgi:hypothetical protein
MVGFVDLSAFTEFGDTAPYRAIVPSNTSNVSTSTSEAGGNQDFSGGAAGGTPASSPIIAEVTILEGGSDELWITEHPVEQGATISDHAFKRPAELHLRLGWSNAFVGGDVNIIYEQLLTLQALRQPFMVFTGKRPYQNMLVASIRVETDARTEFVLIADIIMREVVLVNTQVIAGNIPTNANQLANPSSNMPTQNSGQNNTQPFAVQAAQLTAAGSAGL